MVILGQNLQVIEFHKKGKIIFNTENVFTVFCAHKKTHNMTVNIIPKKNIDPWLKMEFPFPWRGCKTICMMECNIV